MKVKQTFSEKWAIKSCMEVADWIDRSYRYGTDYTSIFKNYKYLIYPLHPDHLSNEIPEGYTEITIEQFREQYIPTCKENLKVEEDNIDKPRISAEEFDGIIADSMERCKNLLFVKGKEYIRNGDKFHNFRRAAKMRNQTMLQALQGMLDKHLVSWLDIIDDLSDPNLTETNITPEYVKEKLGDIDTYFHIAEPLIYERLLEIKEKGKQLIK